MNKINLHHTPAYPTDAQSVVSTFQPFPVSTTLTTRHLLVLIPEDIDRSTETRRIWELGRATGMPVRLLGLCKDATQESGLRRRLVTMASLLQDGRVSVEANVSIGTSWMDLVKIHYQTGDVIVCFAEQRTGLLHRPLSQVLESNFNATVHILSSLSPQQPRSNLLSQVGTWLGFLGIIFAFGILQVNAIRLSDGWFQNLLLILSLVPEFWLICVWHGRFG